MSFVPSRARDVGSLAAGIAFLATVATSAFAASLGAHPSQAAACRASLTRIPSTGDAKARTEAAVRGEECFVRANDGALPALEQAAGEDADVPNAVQTYRDASASLCALLSEKASETDAPAARALCVAAREGELARLIDSYALGSRAATFIASGVSACDDAFKAKHAPSDPATWTALASCTADDVKAKSHSFVTKAAEGDPLGTLGHTPEHVAVVFATSMSAGEGVCDVLAPATSVSRARCRAEVAGNVSKAVSAVVH